MEIESQDYPKTTSRFLEGYDMRCQNHKNKLQNTNKTHQILFKISHMASHHGSLYFFLPFMLHFILTINEILREKEKKLRQGITVMGMTHMSYWISWFLTSLIKSIILVGSLIMFCYIFQIHVMMNCPILIIYFFFVGYDMAIQAIGFMITTLCVNVGTGYTVAYAFLLLSIVMQLFLTNNFFIYYLYLDDADFIAQVTLFFFNLYPSFHFSKLYGDISYYSGEHFNIEEGKWEQGSGFEYKHLTEPNQGQFRVLDGIKHYSGPNTVESYIYLLLNMTGFLILTWYFDHVFPGNRGSVDTPLFFITQEYWKCPKKYKHPRKLSPHLNESGLQSQEFDYNQQEKVDTVKQEMNRVLKNKQDNAPVSGIRILKLGKTYQKYPFGIKSKKDTVALQNVYLEVNSGELLAILGHNGAGKSTLINVLTGILTPTQGNAQILEYDICEHMEIIRHLMGVCPQFDILWDEMTAYEHLEMFCILKGVDKSLIQQEIDNRLKQVNLLHVKNARISTYSGGMRRRISLAISTIGNPRIIFLDEPTTGMDPKTRRDIWQMIKDLKKDRVVILTTHGMDEADALSDRISVINEGQISCFGTSLYLKNTFGDGYRLTIVSNKENINTIKQVIQELIPSSTFLSESGGSLVISVPIIKSYEFGQFFKIMEEESTDEQYLKIKSMIKDWGISHSTLEEVFMKITKKNTKYFK